MTHQNGEQKPESAGNWLGELVMGVIKDRDNRILDLGCGDMAPTGVIGAGHVGVDLYIPSLQKVVMNGGIALVGKLPGYLQMFLSNSFEYVLMLDVLEHLLKDEALCMIRYAELIATKGVIIFTPNGFVEQDPQPDNPRQRHLCGFDIKELQDMGYTCDLWANESPKVGPIQSIFAVNKRVL